jgi:membrane fusion protein, multidrug efflux system
MGRWLALVLLGCCALGSACRKAEGPGARPIPAVTAQQPVQREVVDWDEYPGRLEAVESVEIRARVNGYLQSAPFKDGAEVNKGDLLFVIDPRPYEAEVERTRANLKQAQARLELTSNELARAERLLKTKTISEEEADSRSKAAREAEAALQSARASLDTAQLNLEYTHITAPISGRIGRRLITEGNLVNGNQAMPTLLTTIVSLDPIYSYFDTDEGSALRYQKLAREQKGANFRAGEVPAELELANESGFPHKGTLDFVDNRVDPGTGTLRLRGVFRNPGPQRVLQPGFFSRVRVPGSALYQGLLVPDPAVGTDQGEKFVYVVSDQDEVQRQAVQLGPLVDHLRVVRAGLGSNQWVVVNGMISIRPGMKVQAKREPLMMSGSGTNTAEASHSN